MSDWTDEYSVNDWMQVYPLSDKYRLASWQDAYAERPDEWGDLNILTLKADWRDGRMDTKNDYTETLKRLLDIAGEYEQDPIEVLTKHLNRAGMVSKAITLHGASQSEWHDVLVYLHPCDNALEAAQRVLSSLANALREWYRGEVYTVALQERVDYVSENDPEDKHWHWNTVEIIGGVYSSDLIGHEDDLAKELGYQPSLSV